MNSGTLIGGLDLAQRFKKELVALHYRWFGSHRFQILVISKLIGIFFFCLYIKWSKKNWKFWKLWYGLLGFGLLFLGLLFCISLIQRFLKLLRIFKAGLKVFSNLESFFKIMLVFEKFEEKKLEKKSRMKEEIKEN